MRRIMKKLLSIITILTILMAHAAYAKVDKDVNVAKVQSMLAELCYEPCIVDGAWGKKTETAVKAFFAKHFRKYDGNFDVKDANFILSAGASAKAFGSASVKKCLVVYSDRIGNSLKNAKIKQITQKVANKNEADKFKLSNAISKKNKYNNTGVILLSENFENSKKLKVDDRDNNWVIEKENKNSIYCNKVKNKWTDFNFGRRNWSDYSISFKMKFITENGGKVETHIRKSNQKDYRAEINQFADKSRIQLLNNIFYPDVELSDWLNVKLTANGSEIKFLINDELVISASDELLDQGGGMIAVSANSKVCIDDIVVRSLNNTKTNQVTQKNKLKKFKAGLTERKTIQFGLIALGYLKGKMNGNWDKKSNVALEIYLNKKNSKLKQDDFNEVIELLIKDLSKTELAVLQKNIRKNSTILQYSRDEMKYHLAPQKSISISDFKNMGKHNVYIAVDKKIMVNGNTRFNGNDKIFIIDSFINSKSTYRNQYGINFGGRSFLNIINSISDSDENMEAFLFTYSGNATAMHLNFKHSMSSPWQVAKSHKGQFNFIDSTCNMTLFENSGSDINCNRADRVMIEPLLPRGRYEVSLPSNEKVKEWKSHKSLPWSINIKDSYIRNIDFGISPGVNLTVVDTDDFRGGIAMCCSGIGKITGLKANKLYENQSWSVSSDQGRAKLTLKNSSTGGVWPTAWGQYNFIINNSDLVDPTVGQNASMTIENSSLNMIRAQEQARVYIKNSILTDTDDTSKKISAINASFIKIENLKGLKQRHIYEGGGRVIVKKD